MMNTPGVLSMKARSGPLSPRRAVEARVTMKYWPPRSSASWAVSRIWRVSESDFVFFDFEEVGDPAQPVRPAIAEPDLRLGLGQGSAGDPFALRALEVGAAFEAKQGTFHELLADRRGELLEHDPADALAKALDDGFLAERLGTARVDEVDRIVGRVGIRVERGDRVLTDEPAGRRVVVARPGVVQPGSRIRTGAR